MEVRSYVQNPDGTQQVVIGEEKRLSLKMSVIIIIAIVVALVVGAVGMVLLIKLKPGFVNSSVTEINRNVGFCYGNVMKSGFF